MGVTGFTKNNLEKIIEKYNILSVLNLGAQNDYTYPTLPAPYIRHWYESQGIHYTAIDLSGEDGCFVFDLSKPCEEIEDPTNRLLFPVDLVSDEGTQEHIGTNGAFSWEATYNCIRTKHMFLKIGGIMYSENPATGNWPGHSFSYVGGSFWPQFVRHSDYEAIDIGAHAAMGNTTDGWNVYAILKKTGPKFPTLEEFMTFDLRRS